MFTWQKARMRKFERPNQAGQTGLCRVLPTDLEKKKINNIRTERKARVCFNAIDEIKLSISPFMFPHHLLQ